MQHYRSGRPTRLPLIAASVVIAGIISLAPHPAHAGWHKQQRDIMGTRVSIELWHENGESANACSAKAFAEMRRIEASMSTYQSDSEITYINNNAAIGAVQISAEMAHLVERSLHFSEISRAAFDITYASIG